MAKCSICTHPEVEAITNALAAGISLRRLEAMYDVTRSSLSRHQAHAPGEPTVAACAAAQEETHGIPDWDVLLQQVALVSQQAHKDAAAAYRFDGRLRNIVSNIADALVSLAHKAAADAGQPRPLPPSVNPRALRPETSLPRDSPSPEEAHGVDAALGI